MRTHTLPLPWLSLSGPRLFVSTLSCSISYRTCLQQRDDPPARATNQQGVSFLLSLSRHATQQYSHPSNTARHRILHGTGTLRSSHDSQDRTRTAACTERTRSPFWSFYCGRPSALAHPPPSQPRWTSQRSALWHAALFDYARLRGLFRGMFTYRLHYTSARHNESGMSESIIQSALEDLDGR